MSDSNSLDSYAKLGEENQSNCMDSSINVQKLDFFDNDLRRNVTSSTEVYMENASMEASIRSNITAEGSKKSNDHESNHVPKNLTVTEPLRLTSDSVDTEYERGELVNDRMDKIKSVNDESNDLKNNVKMEQSYRLQEQSMYSKVRNYLGKNRTKIRPNDSPHLHKKKNILSPDEESENYINSPEDILRSMNVVKQSISDLANEQNVEIKTFQETDKTIHNSERRQKHDALLLHEIFQKFCTPAPSFIQILNIVKQVEFEQKNGIGRSYKTHVDSCHLPQDVVVSSGEAGTRVIKLLTQDISKGLLALPENFQLAFFRILIRLLMNETDEEYLDYFSETDVENYGVSSTTKKRSIIDSKKEVNLRNSQNVTTEESYKGNSGEADSRKEQNYRNILQKQSSFHVHKNTLKGNYIYCVVRFCCCTEWKRYMSSPLDETLRTSFLNVAAQGAMVAILRLLRNMLSESHNSKAVAPVIRLLGVIGTGGMSPQILRQILDFISKRKFRNHDTSINYSFHDRIRNTNDDPNSLKYNVPNSARLSLIRALCFSVKGGSQSTKLLRKASPRSFFNFDNGTGLSAELPHWPLKNEYGFATWFRFDSVPPDSTIVSMFTNNGIGFKVSLESLPQDSSSFNAQSVSNDVAILVISVYESSNENKPKSQLNQQVRLRGFVLCPHVWYHLAVRHTEPRYRRYFSNTCDEVTVFVDGRMMLSDELKFPKISFVYNETKRVSPNSPSNTKLSFAKNFNGQTGALYFFKESVSDATLNALFEITSGVSDERKNENNESDWSSQKKDITAKTNFSKKDVFLLNHNKQEKNSNDTTVSKEKIQTIRNHLNSLRNVPDKGFDDDPDEFSINPLSKSSFGMKLLLVWDPSRALNDVVVEGYNGINAFMNADETQTWYIIGARDIISSIGGIQSLLSLFESFLIPTSNDLPRQKGGSNISMITTETRLSRHEDRSVYWMLPHLISLLAQFIRNNNEHAEELLACGGIDVLEQYLCLNKQMYSSSEGNFEEIKDYEFLMQRTSESIPAASKLVDSLEDLLQAASFNTTLQGQIFSKLIFNIPLWFGGTIKKFGIAFLSVHLP